MKVNSINKLLKSLNPNIKNVEVCDAVVNNLKLGVEEVREYCFWKDSKYTRNLISKTEAYELFVCCWHPGQNSSLHDLNGQHGWIYVVDGELELEVCTKNENNLFINEFSSEQTKILSKGKIYAHSPGKEMYRLKNVGADRAISLHLYSLPISYYSILNGTSTDVDYINVAYDSISGFEIK